MSWSIEMTDALLVLICFFVSLLSPSIGTSGGVTFAVMATVMPPTVVVPVHGLIEGVASTMRWGLLRQYVNYRYLFLFTSGTVIGLVLGWPLIGRFSDDFLRTLLGVFFLFSVWAPLTWMRAIPLLAGISTSCLSVVVGATGPLVAALIARRESEHCVVIATQGACTSFQHFGKAMLFGLWGFSFAQYIELIVLMILVTIVGTSIGKHILIKSSKRMLRLLLNTVVAVLGMKLLIAGQGIRLTHVPIGSWLGGLLIVIVILICCHFAYRLGVKKNQASEIFDTAIVKLKQ